jgi:Fe-S-cluster containining protein
MSSDRSSETLTATADFTVSGRKVRLQMDVPTAPVHTIDLLPMFQSLTDTFVKIAVDQAQADGSTISCRKGCGACCRQLVPISEVEVRAIQRLVSEMPEPRKSNVRERFRMAAVRLAESGLLEKLRVRDHRPEEAQSLGIAYFEQRIPCPFLEDESCSIHAERPLACREYLVTSPAENCAKPTAETVKCVDMPIKVSRAIRHLDTGIDKSASFVPMILALEWRQVGDERVQRQAGTSIVATLFRQLTGKEIPEAGSGTSGVERT